MSPAATQNRPRGDLAAITSKLRSGLFAEWKTLSPQLDSELPERDLRIAWVNKQLAASGKFPGRQVSSWSELRVGEARYLLRRMREATGSAAEYRAEVVRFFAQQYWQQGNWESELLARLFSKHQLARPQDLDRSQAHAFIEELISRIARREIVAAGDTITAETVEHKMEEVRERFSPQRHRGADRGARRA